SFTPGKSVARPKAETRIIKNIPKVAPAAIVVTPVAEETVVLEMAAANNYFIIAGAFSIEQNAKNLVEDLKSKGYDSSITGQNRRGLYMVSLQGFNDKKAAAEKMNEIRNGEFPGAWLLSMK
ncbi:MAG: SPOR domain-containing protein, partial [Lentimicrobium sp.]|nr:SPOR domain-containing protein [Lentimicrobium sp.]